MYLFYAESLRANQDSTYWDCFLNCDVLRSHLGWNTRFLGPPQAFSVSSLGVGPRSWLFDKCPRWHCCRGHGSPAVKQRTAQTKYWSDGCFYPTLHLFWSSGFFKTSQEIMNSREASWNIREDSEPSHKFRVQVLALLLSGFGTLRKSLNPF